MAHPSMVSGAHRVLLDGEHRAGAVEQDALGGAAHEQLADSGASTQADDEHGSAHLLDDLDHRLGNVSRAAVSGPAPSYET